MFRSPHLVEAVSLAAWFATCLYFSLTAKSTMTKTKNKKRENKPTGYMFRYKHCKLRKAKEKVVMYWRVQGNYDELWRAITTCLRVYVITMFCSKWARLSLRCYVLCARRQICLFFWLAELLLKSRLGSKTWRPTASFCRISSKRRGLVYIFSCVA